MTITAQAPEPTPSTHVGTIVPGPIVSPPVGTSVQPAPTSTVTTSAATAVPARNPVPGLPPTGADPAAIALAGAVILMVGLFARRNSRAPSGVGTDR